MCSRVQGLPGQSARTRAFTLVELLVVLVIVGLISAVALPTLLSAMAHRQVSEAARILQGALVGARDKAIHDGRPSGIRLLPDPAWPLAWDPTTGRLAANQTLAYSRIVPIDPAPEYQEGMVTVRAGFAYAPKLTNTSGANVAMPTLLLEEAIVDPRGAPNPPTSWTWNVRVGDRIQLNHAGPWYTVVGPMWVGPAAGNSEMFVNVGPPGARSLLDQGNGPLDYLLLANGIDDNRNGWVDEGWDGVDNDGNGQTDEVAEWEVESWHGAAASGLASQPYTIRRRPMPSPNAREVALPTSMVIDATTAFTTRERSRLPVDRSSGTVEVLINPDGTVAYSSPYGPPSSFGMGDAFYHFWLAERSDVIDVPAGATGSAPHLPIGDIVTDFGLDQVPYFGPRIKGGFSILTLGARSGRLAVADGARFDNPAMPIIQFYPPPPGQPPPPIAYNPAYPTIPARQGAP